MSAVSHEHSTRRMSASSGGRHVARNSDEVGIWTFIGADLLDFTLLFGVWLYSRAANRDMFATGQAALNKGLGLVNTLVLLFSSLLVVLATRALRRNERGIAAKSLIGAIACGVTFAVVKVIEWSAHIGVGDDVHRNEFWMYFYSLTGWHLLHVLCGIGLLSWCVVQTRRRGLSQRRRLLVEGSAWFWHLVDLLWLVLFPLIYLVP